MFREGVSCSSGQGDSQTDGTGCSHQDYLRGIESCGLYFIPFFRGLMTGKIIEYGLYGDPPKILGIDLAGVIEEVGPDVQGYKKGDRMYPPDPSLISFSFAIPQAL